MDVQKTLVRWTLVCVDAEHPCDVKFYTFQAKPIGIQINSNTLYEQSNIVMTTPMESEFCISKHNTNLATISFA